MPAILRQVAAPVDPREAPARRGRLSFGRAPRGRLRGRLSLAGYKKTQQYTKIQEVTNEFIKLAEPT